MDSNIKLMIQSPERWQLDHYQLEKNQVDIKDQVDIQEVSFNFGTFSSYIIEASILQHEDITRQMVDSGIIIINKLDNVLFDFHKKHPDIKLHLSTSNQHYSSSNTLRIEMTSKEDFIWTEIPFFKLYEDWNGPKYLFTQLEAMHKKLRLKGEH